MLIQRNKFGNSEMTFATCYELPTCLQITMHGVITCNWVQPRAGTQNHYLKTQAGAARAQSSPNNVGMGSRAHSEPPRPPGVTPVGHSHRILIQPRRAEMHVFEHLG